MTVVRKAMTRLRNRAVGGADAPESEVSAVSAVLRAVSALRAGVPTNRVRPTLAADGIRPAQGDAPEWRVVAAVMQLAEESGAPVVAALERLAHALGALDRLEKRREVLLSGPRATIRLVGALPIAAMLLGSLLGFDPIPLLLSTGGFLLVTFGTALLVAGVCWARRMTRSLESVVHIAGLEFELVWIALRGGAPPAAAVRRVADCADEQRAVWIRLSRLRGDGPVRAAIASAEALGTPVGPMLLAEAEAARARAHTELEGQAERLGVRVLIPLAVCVLPAFIVLGVIPVLLAVLGGMNPI